MYLSPLLIFEFELGFLLLLLSCSKVLYMHLFLSSHNALESPLNTPTPPPARYRRVQALPPLQASPRQTRLTNETSISSSERQEIKAERREGTVSQRDKQTVSNSLDIVHTEYCTKSQCLKSKCEVVHVNSILELYKGNGPPHILGALSLPPPPWDSSRQDQKK